MTILCLPSVLAVSPIISIDPSSGPLETPVTIAASYSGDQEGVLVIRVLPDETPISFKSCNLTSPCQDTADHIVEAEGTGFYAEYDTDGVNLFSNEVFFQITTNTPPSLNYFFIPEEGTISVPMAITFEAVDDSAVERVIIDFDDGSVPLEISCTSNTCKDDGAVAYMFELPGTYNVTMTAFDDEGAQMPVEFREVRVSGVLDSDEDGIPDEDDFCPNTNSQLPRDLIAQSGELAGCACEEIDPSDFGDGNLCTAESCIITDTGELEIVHTAVPNDFSPSGLSGVCRDGVYVSGACNSDDAQVCFGNLGNEQPFCFDGNSFYEQLDVCDNNEVCQVINGKALCVEGAQCLSIPGCRFSQPANAQSADGVCDGGERCYECRDGFRWDGLQCVTELACPNPFYNDNDGDGQGAGVASCDNQFPRGVQNGLDCNDNNARAFVGNIEFCDGVDNDCDGRIDDNCVQEL